MKRLVLLGALALAACNPSEGADGYTFEQGSQRIPERPIPARTTGDRLIAT